MAEREAFLGMVRAALGHQPGREIEPDEATQYFSDSVETDAQAVREHVSANAGGLLDAMAAAAATAGWNVRRAGSPEDAAEAVLEICKAANASTALRSAHGVFERVPVDGVLAAGGITVETAMREPSENASDDLERRVELRARTFEVDVGITGVDYAIAETGTVVIEPRRGVSRLVSLTPPVHIALLEAGQVLPSLDELFLLAREEFLAGTHRGMINLITGPSRTADIEASLVLGVHGPVEVHLVIAG